MPEVGKKTTMSVRELREILGLGKTESYWLVHKNYFKTVLVNKKMRVDIESFEKWYVQQQKHRTKKDRAADRVREEISLSMPEAARELGIPRNEVYKIFKSKSNRGKFEYLKIRDQWRVTRASFDQWYNGQAEYVKPDERPEHVAAESERERRDQTFLE